MWIEMKITGKHAIRKIQLSYKQVVCICLMAVVLILLCVFGIYSFYDYSRECQNVAEREAKNTSLKVVSQVDERLNNLRQYYVTKVMEEDIKWVIDNQMDYSDYIEIKEAQDAFACKTYLDDYVKGYTFVNYKTGWILNSKGMFPMEEAVNEELLTPYFTDTDVKKDKYYWVYDTSEPIRNMIDRNYRTTLELDGLNYVMRLPYVHNPSAMLIVNINMESWKNWIHQCLEEDDQIVVMDPDGQVIYTTSEALGSLLGTNEFAEQLIARGKINFEGKEYMGQYAVSGILGWRYYVFHNIDMAGRGLSAPLILWLLAFVFMTCLMIVLATYAIYHPISALVKDVAIEDGTKPVRNELEFLAGSFQSLKDDKKALQDMMSQSRDKLLELFELRLLKGEVRSEEWEEYTEDFHLRKWNYFATVVLVLNLSEEEIQNDIKEDVICLKLLEEMPEAIKKLAWMPPIYNSCTISAIFAENDENILLSRISEYYQAVSEYAQKMSGYKILMGVSSNHIDRKHIQAAYRESIKALTYSTGPFEEHTNREDELEHCYFYLSSTTTHDSGNYDITIEKEVQTGIKTLDKNLCYKATDNFYFRLKEMNFSQHEANVYTLQFANAILLTAVEAKLNLEKLFPQGIRKLYGELLDAFEPNRTRQYIKSHLIDPILNARGELLDQTSYSMMEEIEKLISESKGNITLTECADSLQVHPTYIWKILKMNRGKSFSDYVEEYKLEEAKRLLLNSSMSVAEIAAELNYTNSQNFIRFFSKSMGITPGKFRKING